MIKRLKKQLKNQKGFTLVELLAVIVILGVIAAIAVPSIAGVMERSKKDATVANAEQMIEAARMMIVSENIPLDTGTKIYLNDSDKEHVLTDDGYLESGLADTTGAEYDTGSFVEVVKSGDQISYEVYLEGTEFKIGTSANPEAESNLNRDSVQEATAS